MLEILINAIFFSIVFWLVALNIIARFGALQYTYLLNISLVGVCVVLTALVILGRAYGLHTEHPMLIGWALTYLVFLFNLFFPKK